MLRETARVTALAATLLGLPEMACDVLAQAGAETIATRVVVRVIGRDSKIIGSGVGGACSDRRDLSGGKAGRRYGRYGPDHIYAARARYGDL